MLSHFLRCLALISGAAVIVAGCAGGPAKRPNLDHAGTSAPGKQAGNRQREALEQRLRGQITATPATLEAGPGILRLRVVASAVFTPDASSVSPDGRQLISQLAGAFRDYPQTKLLVSVYSDDLEEPTISRSATAARALAVAGVMQEEGIDPVRISTVGAGQSQPVGDNATPEGRSANRRLEIQISPLSF